MTTQFYSYQPTKVQGFLMTLSHRSLVPDQLVGFQLVIAKEEQTSHLTVFSIFSTTPLQYWHFQVLVKKIPSPMRLKRENLFITSQHWRLVNK